MWQERSQEPFLLETSMPGVFAAGDVRGGSIKGAPQRWARALWRSGLSISICPKRR